MLRLLLFPPLILSLQQTTNNHSVVIVSLIRLKTISVFSQTVNPTSEPLLPPYAKSLLTASPSPPTLPAEDIADVSLWSGIEIDVGVICPCLPSFRLLVRRLRAGHASRPNQDSAAQNNGLGRMPLGIGIGGGKTYIDNTFADMYSRRESSGGDTSVAELVEVGRGDGSKRRKGSI